jgi:hypothetical protein
LGAESTVLSWLVWPALWPFYYRFRYSSSREPLDERAAQERSPRPDI